MKLHFISGLPRSGSTLLAALLDQNPRFHVGVSSPAAAVFQAVERATGKNVETSAELDPEDRDNMLRGVVEGRYKRTRAKDRVIFEGARWWCARLPVLHRLYPRAKVIACVREIGWILDSFERLHRKNGMAPSHIYAWQNEGTVYSRVAALADPSGVVGFSINAVREAVASEEAEEMLMLLDYEFLCKQPEAALRVVYGHIGEPYFAGHDFDRIAFDVKRLDAQMGTPGMHDVAPQVAWTPRTTILPKDLFDQMNGPNFWRPNVPAVP